MSVQFNVSVAWDKTSYVAGEIITGHITGDATNSTDPTSEMFTVDISAAAQPSGAVTTIHTDALTVTHPGTTTPETVQVTAVTGGGRTWTISADGRSFTAVA